MINQKELNNLEWPIIINEIKKRASSECGEKKISNLEQLSFEMAKEQLDYINELKNSFIENISPDFSGFLDNLPSYIRLEKGSVLSLEEVLNIRKTVIAFENIRIFFKSNKEKFIKCESFIKNFSPLKELKEFLCYSLTDNGEINGNAYPEIGKIQKEIYKLKNDIEKKLSKFVNSSENSAYVQEKIYTDVSGRYVILLKANMKGKVKGSVLDVSATGSTIYLEPDFISSLNTNLIIKKTELERELQKVLAEISYKTSEHSDDLKNNQELASYIDCLCAITKFSILIRANVPQLTQEPVIDIYSARHPLLYLYNAGDVVSNNIKLGEKYSCLIISGANTGGKTVLLKTVGLCAAMVNFGMPIPASPDSKIGLFTNIIAEIGDDQNLKESLSTFSGHIIRINEMIQNSDKNSLLLVDEIVSGTNPRYGAALSRSILKHVVNKNSKIIVTTHYPELKDLPAEDNRFLNGSVSFDIDSLKPTYTLNTGIPGISYTFEIAKIYNLPGEIIKNAKEYLSSNDLSTEALIEKIQKYEQQIYEEKEEILNLKHELNIEKDKYKKLKKDLAFEIIKAKENQGILFIDELQDYRKSISERIKNLQNLSLKDSSLLQNEISDLQDNINKKINQFKKEKHSGNYKKFSVNIVKIGDTIFISPLEKMATLVEIDEKNKSATLLLGNSLKSKFKFKDLMLPPMDIMRKTTTLSESSGKSEKNKSKNSSSSNSIVPITIQTSYNTIDLRGMHVEEAINKMELELDQKMRSGIHSAVIIHGHGTGALKKAIRDHLKYSFYLEDFRPGEQNEGGDGVTIALIKK